MTFGRRAAALIIAWTALAALGCAAGGGSVNPPSAATAQKPAPVAETYSGQLLRRRCQGCHRLPRPEAKSARAWQDALTRMKRRVKLPPADWDSLAALGTRDTTSAAPSR